MGCGLSGVKEWKNKDSKWMGLIDDAIVLRVTCGSEAEECPEKNEDILTT